MAGGRAAGWLEGWRAKKGVEGRATRFVAFLFTVVSEVLVCSACKRDSSFGGTRTDQGTLAWDLFVLGLGICTFLRDGGGLAVIGLRPLGGLRDGRSEM